MRPPQLRLEACRTRAQASPKETYFRYLRRLSSATFSGAAEEVIDLVRSVPGIRRAAAIGIIGLGMLTVPAAAGSILTPVSELPGADPKAMLDAMEQTSRITKSPDDLVEQFMVAFVRRNGPQMMMYMAEPLRREWMRRHMPSTWMPGVSSPWYEDFAIVSRAEPQPGSLTYQIRVITGLIGNHGDPVYGSCPLKLSVTKHAGRWYLVDWLEGYPPCHN